MTTEKFFAWYLVHHILPAILAYCCVCESISSIVCGGGQSLPQPRPQRSVFIGKVGNKKLLCGPSCCCLPPPSVNTHTQRSAKSLWLCVSVSLLFQRVLSIWANSMVNWVFYGVPSANKRGRGAQSWKGQQKKHKKWKTNINFVMKEKTKDFASAGRIKKVNNV